MEFRQTHMLNFLNRKAPAPPFSLDRRDQVRRSHMRKREWRAVIMLPVAILVVAMFIHFLVDMSNDLGALNDKHVFTGEIPLPPMERPVLEHAPPLPSEAQLVAAGDEVRNLLADPALVATRLSGPDALSLAWARSQLAEDEKLRPIPQHLMARDLVAGSVSVGTPCLITGRLDDTNEAVISGGTPMLRLLIAMEEGQWVEVLAPRETSLVVGRPVQIVGRFLGFTPSSAGSSAPAKIPLVVARLAHEADPAESAAELQTAHEWSAPGQFVLPQGVFNDLDDERTYIETRPYYFALGQIRQESTGQTAYDQALDLNKVGNDVHQDPQKYRNAVMKLTGEVYQSWEDRQVALDRPFGVARVIRILLYHSDYGPITETINGKEITRNRLVQRLFELAVVSDQPLPKQHDLITASGHFLKFHAIPVRPDQYRDRVHHVERQSTNVYTFFLVSGPYRELPVPHMYDFKTLEILVIATVLVMVVTFWRLSRRERAAAEVVQNQVRLLRRTRREITGKAAGAATGTVETPPAPPGSGEPPSPPIA